MKDNLLDLKDVLIISDYDSGYRFSVYFNSLMYRGGYDEYDEVLNVCEKFIDRPHALQEALEEFNIFPKYIIVCSDGGVEITKLDKRIEEVK